MTDSGPLGSGSRHCSGDAPTDATVCTVATRPDTFRRCREGFYPCPASYPRTDRDFSYLACYRTAPTSAITHYAPVCGRVLEEAGAAAREGTIMDRKDWAETIEPVSDERRAVVFRLGGLVALESPVRDDQSGVRGAWYSQLRHLREADTLSELAERAEQTA